MEAASSSVARDKVDSASNEVDVFSYHCEPHPARVELVAWLECLERLKNLLMELHRNAGSIVFHYEFEKITLIAESDPHRAAIPIVVPDCVVH